MSPVSGNDTTQVKQMSFIFDFVWLEKKSANNDCCIWVEGISLAPCRHTIQAFLLYDFRDIPKYKSHMCTLK